MPRLSLRERLLTVLLRLFPSEFRGDFGDQIRDDFHDQESEARTRSRRAVARLWIRTAWDFVRRGPREHADVIVRDAKFGARLLMRSPGLAVSTLVTLAVGIGLNTAVFSVVNGVLLRPLPYPQADRLVRIFETTPSPDRKPTEVSSANFIDWAAETRTLDAVGMYGGTFGTFLGQSDPEWLNAMAVSDRLLNMLEARPALGRLFVASDYEAMRAYYRARDPKQPSAMPAPSVIILSHALWQRQFQGRPDVIGSTVRFRGATVEIVGVMRPEFGFTDTGWSPAEAWVPEAPDPLQRRARFRHAIGRLAPGVSIAAARTEFDLIARRLAAAYPRANADRGVIVSPLLDVTVADARTLLFLLLGAAGCVLLIACANVANLLLAHASGRRMELATRVALGASRGHLVRQTLTEGMCLGCVAGAAGFVMASLALPYLLHLAPPELPRLNEIGIDGRALAFSLALSLAVGAVCGLIACFSVSSVAPTSLMKSVGADAGTGGRRVRQSLAVAEIALALILVVAASLLVRTMRAVGALPLGFNPANVISVGLAGSGSDKGAAFDVQVLERVRAIPGVLAAGIGTRPLGGGMLTVMQPLGDEKRRLDIGAESVSVGYLEALGGTMIEGRFFDGRDTSGAPRVAIVNQTAARHFWPQRSAVGQAVETPSEERYEVIGVIGDVRRTELEAEPGPAVYLPNVQATNFRANNLLVRGQGDPKALLPALRTVMRQIDPEGALVRIQTLEETLALATAPRRFTLRLVGAFSLIALGLAMIGIYGVVAESVARRVPEIGIRMALGATRRDVTTMIVRQGARFLLVGMPLGLAVAIAVRGVMSSFVFGIEPGDPQSYIAACVCLAAATLGASAIPARRAAAIDPVRALRQP